MRTPKILSSCGHTLCHSCITDIQGPNFYVCPECRSSNSTFTTNFALKNALEFFEPRLPNEDTNVKEMMGKSCCHVDFVSKEDLEQCSHCTKMFCPTCLLSHKVYLRLEAGMIASNVRNDMVNKTFH